MTNIQATNISCKVGYTKGFFDHEIQKIEDIQQTIRKFKNTDDYIRHFIDTIKSKVIKTLPNLNLVQIQLQLFDKTNIIHRLFENATKMLFYILSIKHDVYFKKTIFVTVTYEGKLVFAGGIDFNGMQ
jgi:hypothetical protein